ncbi:DNA-directed RNA polymerase II subunit J [Rhizodiscina lignyota]|uniref:DNA-directed RNA polymerase II subunit J n=1 Tax=Rhizodiscina lignyota TaxID=1504668 RepID=A0A9P4HZY0_9PEZI|nr:DNA-directed RNA polymerase II subunit J [Rhizodiscina lignyota]
MSAPGRESELKQQGALEAARDPNSTVTAEDAERKVVDEARAAGSAAYQFDPNATAQEKAAAIASHVPTDFHHVRKPKAAGLATDVDDGAPPDYDLPPPSRAGAISRADTASRSSKGANGKAPEDEEWERMGWAPRFGVPKLREEDDGTMLDHQTWLEGKIDDKFFGDWYHNAGIIIFACLMSWTIAVLGGGLAWVFIIMATCGTYYRTSIRRVRRNFRDDVNRELAKNRLETDNESLEWINSFLVKFWPIYAPVLCKTIVSSVDQVLSTSTPAFLDSLRLKTFTLGTKPPRLEHVKTYPKSEDDIVLMDWKFSFNPNDVADLTARQIKIKQNPKVVLEVRIGKAMVSKGLDVIVEDMAFSGLMRVKVKLQLPFPHIDRVEISFLGKPDIDYVCKPLGGDSFGFDINFIPGLQEFIMNQIHNNLGPMMYDPNVFPIEVAKMLAGTPVDQAIGVLQVTFHGAQGLKNPDKFSGTPDPYAVVSINQRNELGRTKTVHESANPRWGETVNVIITSLKDSLTLQVFDYNEYRKDKELGVATFPLEKFEEDDEWENQELEVTANGRSRGLISADIRFFPVLESAHLEDGTVEPPPESMTGIAKFTVEQAKDLDGTKSLIGELNPYAVLLLNGKEVHTSKKLKRTNNPIWPDATKELLITNRKTAKLGLVLKDDRELSADPIIGTYQIRLDDMLELTEKGQEWYNVAGVKSGRVKMALQWKPVALRGALAGGGYITPIGVIRIHFQNARNLRNVEAMGKSDPYARVLLSGIEKGRTVTWKNNLNPDFDEVIYVPMHSDREKLVLEVMDQENFGKDRTLGYVELAASDYIHQESTGEYAVHEEKKTQSRGLRMGRGPEKGILNFTCSFYPTIPVVDPDEEERERERASMETVPTPTGRKSIESGRPSTANETRSRSGTIGSLRSHKTNGSIDMKKQLAAGEQEQEEVKEIKPEVPKIRLTADDLLNYESGLIIFTLIDGEFSNQGCHLEVVMDDHLFPSYTSSKVKQRHASFNEIGDAMVRELDMSRITLRLVQRASKDDEKKDNNVIAKLTGQTLEILRRALYTPTQLVLRDGAGENKVTVSLKYLPIKMQLDPSESFNNQGNLRVEVLDAADLPAADRNGYSDPYCKFILNDKSIYKTAIQKKTLHPAWNEFFETPIKSRTAAEFRVEVYDWDFGDKADFLGKADINLDILEPMQQQEVVLGLDGKSGTIRLKMLFRPDFVQRSRQGSSTFHGTFDTPGKIIGAPVKGVGKGAVLVGGGVIKGASFLGKGFRRRKSRAAADEDAGEDSPSVNGDGSPMTPNVTVESPSAPGTPSPHARTKSWGAASTAGLNVGGADQGMASITIASAHDFPPSANLRIHIKMESSKGAKEVFKTKAVKIGEKGFVWSGEESNTRVPCGADTQFRIVAKDHGHFGMDDDLGEGVFFVDDQGKGGEKEVKVGSGRVVVRSSFTPADAASSATGRGLKESPRGLRRGVFGTKRESRETGRERSVTPSGV